MAVHQAPYNDAFFSGHQSGSARSAAVIVPLLLRHFSVRSVIDVGCGIGSWLAEFARYDISDYLGVDGDHVPRDLLAIARDKFFPADLTSFIAPERRFDLACSLEVAEHLPPGCANSFIKSLVDLSPVVLFSAAIPDQGGTGHRNEQWQSYWAALFRNHGYVALDCIRPVVFRDARVELWYRQNTLVFCAAENVPSGMSPTTSAYELDRVDPDLLHGRTLEREPRRRLRNFFRSRAE